MHRHRIFFQGLLIVLIILISLQMGTVSGEDCHNCHGTDGDYTFQHLSVSSLTPRVVNPGETFKHIIVVKHPGSYQAKSISVELDLSSAPNLKLSSSKNVQLETMDLGEKEVIFHIQAGEPIQSQKIRTIVTYIADYHYDPTNYIEILDISITIDKILLSPSTWSVDLKIGLEKQVTLKALEPINNISIIHSSSLENIVDINYKNPKSLSTGQSLEIQIKGKNTGHGKFNIVYEDEGGIPHKITLDIIIKPKVSDKESIWISVGMVTGLLSWNLLFLSVIVGAPIKRMKLIFNKYFGTGLVRNEFHCGISYILVVLALFHAVVVMGNHWHGAIIGSTFIIANPNMDYGVYINLGTISWFLIISISITGIFWKRIIKIIKYKSWRWTHNVITILALITSLTHGGILLYARLF